MIETRDLLFLRKDNLVYFIDINGNPLDSGLQKLFERNETEFKTPYLRQSKSHKIQKVLPFSHAHQ